MNPFNQIFRVMKNLVLSTAILALVSLASCYTETVVGPEGPQGRQGPVGPKGDDGESGYVFEWENINFTAPNYDVVLSYPSSFKGLDSDVALVYLLWDTYTNGSGEQVEVWRPLSQTLLTEDGTLIYNFDNSKYDVRLFLEADFSRNMLGAIDTDGWVARVVVVPGNFWNAGRIDFSDYHAVEAALGLPDLSAQRSGYQSRKK